MVNKSDGEEIRLREMLSEDLFSKDIDSIEGLTPQGKELLKSVIYSEMAKDLDPCNAELKWMVVHCDNEFRQNHDVVKHNNCLQAARQKYDECKAAGG